MESSLSRLSRHRWKSACQFHPLTQKEVLEEVHRRVEAEEHPLVLLDLDSTLYEVGPRTHQILKEWADAHKETSFSELSDKILELSLQQIGFSVRDTLGGLMSATPSFEEMLKSVYQFWFQRFFTNDYLQWDRAYPGAARFAQRLYDQGAEIVYLTGRDEPNMAEATRANLIRDGFPFGIQKTHLLMKPNFEMPDLDYKLRAIEFLHNKGRLIASFENEPANLVALHQKFPDAMHVFVDTVCSENHAAPCEGLYLIRGFDH